MTTPFISACIQFQSTIGDQENNLKKAESLILGSVQKNAKLVCLPECFDHGYQFSNFKNTKNYSHEKTMNLLQSISIKHDIIISGGFLFQVQEKVLNTHGIFLPDGKIHRYTKTHLIPLLKENEVFQPGSSLFVVNTKFGKLAPFICYDLRFPEISRMAALAGAQILLYPSGWPKPRIEAWNTLLKARAIENQVFVIGSNHVGITPEHEFFGNSQIIDPYGEVLSKASSSKEEIIFSEIDLSVINQLRSQMPVLDQRRPDLYSLGIVHV